MNMNTKCNVNKYKAVPYFMAFSASLSCPWANLH